MEDIEAFMGNNNQNEFEDVKKMNLFQRITGIIVSPAETMKNLIIKPRVVFPILIVALGLLVIYLSNYGLYKDQVRQAMERAMANSSTQLSPEQLDAQADMGAVAGLITGPIVSLLSWVIEAAIIFGLIKAFRGKGRFAQFISITGYAYVIMLLYYVLTAVVINISNNLTVDVPITSVASLLPKDLKGTFLYTVLTGMELFAIWRIIVTGIGITLVSKLSKVKVYSVMFGFFAAQILLGGILGTLN